MLRLLRLRLFHRLDGYFFLWILASIIFHVQFNWKSRAFFLFFIFINQIEKQKYAKALLSITILLCRPKQTDEKKKNSQQQHRKEAKAHLLSICLLVFINTENQLPFKAIYILVLNTSNSLLCVGDYYW